MYNFVPLGNIFRLILRTQFKSEGYGHSTWQSVLELHSCI